MSIKFYKSNTSVDIWTKYYKKVIKIKTKRNKLKSRESLNSKELNKNNTENDIYY